MAKQEHTYKPSEHSYEENDRKSDVLVFDIRLEKPNSSELRTVVFYYDHPVLGYLSKYDNRKEKVLMKRERVARLGNKICFREQLLQDHLNGSVATIVSDPQALRHLRAFLESYLDIATTRADLDHFKMRLNPTLYDRHVMKLRTPKKK
jgi:hypothetical protein